jgi:lipopolysaccharide transport system permease protein
MPLPRVATDLPTALWRAARCLTAHRYLVSQLTIRDVAARYRGSVMGFLWSLIIPLMMLAVYTYMFGMVFKARWPDTAPGDQFQFALLAFAGLIIHMLFSEVLTKAPGAVVGQPNLVKKVVFPLELLSWSLLGGVLFQTAVSVFVLAAFALVLNGGVPWTAVLAPLVLLTALPMLIGLAWFLSSLGVFLRDIGQVMNLLTTVLMFTAPIFYPREAVPAAMQPWLVVNPLTVVVEQFRAVAIFGALPDWRLLGLYLLVGLVVATLGHYWFERTRSAFADVL